MFAATQVSSPRRMLVIHGNTSGHRGSAQCATQRFKLRATDRDAAGTRRCSVTGDVRESAGKLVRQDLDRLLEATGRVLHAGRRRLRDPSRSVHIEVLEVLEGRTDAPRSGAKRMLLRLPASFGEASLLISELRGCRRSLATARHRAARCRDPAGRSGPRRACCPMPWRRPHAPIRWHRQSPDGWRLRRASRSC